MKNVMRDKDVTFRRCENPLCRRIIWSYQYRFGTGLYCDKLCYEDSGKFFKGVKNTTSVKKKLRKPIYHTMFESKNCNTQIDISL
jgi:hypothetical protein